ncbi:MAG: hypothetical protein M3140_09105, partial [Actinomycetota bacterium]|nr:hypothetical protein [Actinomycetota bacterium]
AEQAAAAKRAAADQAAAARKAAARRGVAARKRTSRSRPAALTSPRLDKVNDAVRTAVGRPKPRPAKTRGRTLLRAALLAGVVAAVVAAARALRPKQTARTGSSIPPKVRSLPTPDASSAGGAAVSGGAGSGTAAGSAISGPESQLHPAPVGPPASRDSGIPSAAADGVLPADEVVWTSETPDPGVEGTSDKDAAAGEPNPA